MDQGLPIKTSTKQAEFNLKWLAVHLAFSQPNPGGFLGSGSPPGEMEWMGRGGGGLKIG